MVNYVVHYRGEGGAVRDWVVNDRNLLHAMEWLEKRGYEIIGYEII